MRRIQNRLKNTIQTSSTLLDNWKRTLMYYFITRIYFVKKSSTFNLDVNLPVTKKVKSMIS